MNKLWYKQCGFLIILAGIIGTFLVIKYNGLFFGILYSVGILAVAISHALFYSHVGTGKFKENKLIKLSLVSTIITLFILILNLIISFLHFDDLLSWAITLLFIGSIAGLFYIIAILLLIINWFKNK